MPTLPHGKKLSAEDYAALYADAGGFESVCAEARQQANAAFLRAESPPSILEVGCGPHLLCRMPGPMDLHFSRWTIVEPAARYAEAARTATAGDPRFEIVQAYLEEAAASLPGMREAYAAAIVSGLVQETTAPLELLTAVAACLRPGGKILVGASNALSFHRLLAVECGLIETPYQLSAQDVRLGHAKVYDPQSLAALVAQAGFTGPEAGGSLFKPFTNAQMQALVEASGPHLVPGLIALGRHFPGHAAEIHVVARKP